MFILARADDPVMFKRMRTQHMAFENRTTGVFHKKGFSDELQTIAKKERREPRSSFQGVQIRPTSDTLEVMRGKYR